MRSSPRAVSYGRRRYMRGQLDLLLSLHLEVIERPPISTVHDEIFMP
jgi:hypothetical protein